MQNRNSNYSNHENENRSWRPQSERGTERDYSSNFQSDNQFGGTANPERGTPNDSNYSPSGYRSNDRTRDRDYYGSDRMNTQGYDQDRNYGQSRAYGRNQGYNQGNDRSYGYNQNQGYGQNQTYGQSQFSGRNSSFGQSESFAQNQDYGRDRNFGANRESGRDFGTHYGKGPKNYRRSDERIQEDVQECLWRHGDIDASEIDVNVKDGVVTLSGTIESRTARRAAEEAIEQLPGVQDVKLELQIQKSNDTDFGSKSGSKDAKSDGKSKSSLSGSSTSTASTEKSKMM